MNKWFVYCFSLECCFWRGYSRRGGRSGTSAVVAHGYHIWKRPTEKRNKPKTRPQAGRI